MRITVWTKIHCVAFLLTAASLAAPVALNAQPIRVDTTSPNTGNGLLSICESRDSSSQDFCRGYVFGVSSILLRTRQICIPPEVMASQQVRVVTRFLNNNPERLHL